MKYVSKNKLLDNKSLNMNVILFLFLKNVNIIYETEVKSVGLKKAINSIDVNTQIFLSNVKKTILHQNEIQY